MSFKINLRVRLTHSGHAAGIYSTTRYQESNIAAPSGYSFVTYVGHIVVTNQKRNKFPETAVPLV